MTRPHDDPAGCPAPPAAGPPWHAGLHPPASTDGTEVDIADREYDRPLARELAFGILLGTDVFADTRVGYAGERPVQVEAFQVLLGQPDGATAFEDLLCRARLAGQLYALCGLQLLAPARYAEAEPSYLRSTATVRRLSGCSIGAERVAAIMRSDEPGAIRIRPGEAAPNHWALAPRGRPQPVPDIAGGGYPAAFRDAGR